MNPQITMVVPYYRQPEMLRKQADTWVSYTPETRSAFQFVVVDDASPEHAEDVLVHPSFGHPSPVSLYRIEKDIPWNRGMARNLGVHVATTPWVLHVDTDHVLPPASATALVAKLSALSMKRWYRFKRYRIGSADETRRKDKIPPEAKFGEIKPHIDSYLCTPAAFWRAGGYNEDFSGVLGGGSPFLAEMEKANGEPEVLSCPLYVHTRDSVKDSSECTLPRSPEAFARRKHEIMAAHGTLRGHDPLRLPWHRVL